jgi:hypothetical protein
MRELILLALLVLPGGALAQDAIPMGVVIPARLDATFSSKSKPGEKISARVMQEVPLDGHEKIRVGSHLAGHIVSVTAAKSGRGTRIVFVLDELTSSSRMFPVMTELRALASPVEVDSAQLPASGADRANSPSSWVTTQVGGETVYRGGGHVMDRSQVVGEPVPGGVLGRLRPDRLRGCNDPGEGYGRPQALWIFSTDACGVYGFSNVSIVRDDRDLAEGQIELASKGGLKIDGNSGLLLRVIGSDDPTK